MLINNAGIFQMKWKKTKDGIEEHFQVNHLSHFLLTNLLLDKLIENRPSRIIIVSSHSHYSPKTIDFNSITEESSSSGIGWYNRSKLCNVLHANELQKRLHAKYPNVTVNSLHPGGFVFTNIFQKSPLIIRYIMNLFASLGFTKTVEEGCRTTVNAATNPKYETEGGFYFDDCKPIPSSSASHDEELAKKLWNYSESLCNQVLQK